MKVINPQVQCRQHSKRVFCAANEEWYRPPCSPTSRACQAEVLLGAQHTPGHLLIVPLWGGLTSTIRQFDPTTEVHFGHVMHRLHYRNLQNNRKMAGIKL